MSGPFTQLTSAAFTLICPATQHRMSSKHQLTGPEKHCAGKALTSTPILPALEQDLWYFLLCPDPEKQVSEGLARIGLWEDLAWSPHFYLQVSCISRDSSFSLFSLAGSSPDAYNTSLKSPGSTSYSQLVISKPMFSQVFT
jgi:hypothetical protein